MRVVTDFMRIFEGKALAEALTEAGHSVSEKTAQRWKKGETNPKPQDVKAIRDLVGVLTQKAAPPITAERLEEVRGEIIAEVRQNRAVIAAALARAIAQSVAEDQPELLRRLLSELALVLPDQAG